ncbi:unnamed protein product, partial [Heterosigma akashiwo]
VQQETQPGFFVEIGGNDGRHATNTQQFERCHNWKGMMVEGNPENFKKLRKNRPFLITIGKAACLEGETEVQFTKDAKAAAGVLDYMNEDFIKNWHSRRRGKTKETKTVTVPCSTMQAMLDEHNVTHVDFFSLDVEGAELVVVKTLDFS